MAPGAPADRLTPKASSLAAFLGFLSFRGLTYYLYIFFVLKEFADAFPDGVMIIN